MTSVGYKSKSSAPRQLPETASVRLVVPWWANPLWALILLTGSMAVLSVALPGRIYETWEVQKFISSDSAIVLLTLFLCLAVGVFFTSGVSPNARTVDIHLSGDRLRMLTKAYRILFWLTFIGYAAWVVSAIAQGVGLSNLIAVIERSQGAIGELKNNARPIGGVTTLTQFAPFAVALNILLWKAGIRHMPSLLFFFAAATVRVFFYAERLALIEVLVPLALVGALILSAQPEWRRRIAVAPVVAIPLIWAVFAISEYFRSWVYYSKLTDLPFGEWVSIRLIGYYVTSFNNSALVAQAYESASPLPWFTLQWFWNFPGVEGFIQHSGIGGLPAERWWTSVLLGNANINFTNTGSFLTTYAELGFVGAMILWLATGLAIGALFNALSKGNVPALLLYATMFIGILELPRLMYWTLGRSTPLIIAFIFLAYHWTKPPKRMATRRADRVPYRHI